VPGTACLFFSPTGLNILAQGKAKRSAAALRSALG